MTVSTQELQTWMDDKEDERLEFKEAKTQFDFGKLVKYCAALANEGGGRMILGVTDRRPRTVVGTQAFRGLDQTKADLTEPQSRKHEGRPLVSGEFAALNYAQK